jgi:hypothetical protein
VSRRRKVLSLYARIGRTYWRYGAALVLLAAIVFLPLGLLEALVSEIDVDSLDFGAGIKVAALVAAISLITATSLLGEVFYSGVVAFSLSHPEHERMPPLSEIARKLKYGRLIAIDLVYVAMVLVGLAAFFVPGVLIFVWFGLSGPVVELEDRTVRGALARSWDLVRGNFWVAFFILAPIEVVGDGLSEGLEQLVHAVLGHTLLGGWLAESISNLIFTPIFAVAAVLLALDLIEAKEHGTETASAAPAPTPASA